MRQVSIVKITGLSFIIVLVCMLVSFTSKNDSYSEPSYLFQNYVDDVTSSFRYLDNTAQQFKLGKSSIDSVQQAVKNARLDYKKIEFYLAYHYPEYAKKHFNGAPLFGIQKSGALPDVVPPEGLQVLDELVYAENPKEERINIATAARKLVNHYTILMGGISTKNIQISENIIAMRLEIIRVFTLGLSGFDTPGSLNAIEEAKVSLQAMKDFLSEFSPKKNQKKYNQLLRLLNEAVTVLDQEKSFNNFDRYDFLVRFIEPIYEGLELFQAKETPEFLNFTSSWNPNSSSIFSADFLNPYFFTALKQKEDSPELQQLGKKLFYDTNLSQNEKISCASCHNPELAFTDGKIKSESNLQGEMVLRNAPTLLNAVYADRYFYDLRAFTLEQQAEHVIFNDQEFNTAYSAILKKLEQDKPYKENFKRLFKTNDLTRQQFSKALTSYVTSLTSWNSTFDQLVRNRTENPTPAIKKGFNLFMGKAACATCHFPPTFAGLVPPLYSDSESEILGVLENPTAKKVKLDTDQGRIASQVHNEKAWIYEKSFKTTTTRNTGLTAPYFHNGAYASLEEVIDFYNKGGGAGQGLKVTNQTLAPDPLNLNDQEIKDLIAFITSLNDTNNYQ